MRFRFSAEKLESFAVPGDSVRIAYDRDVRELGIRVQPTGKAVYFLLKKVAGKPYRRTLGDYANLKLDAARKHAHNLLGRVADWLAGDRKDPNPMTRPFDDERLTLQGAFEMYLKAPLKNEGKKDKVVNREKADARRRYLFDHCFSAIAGRPVDEFTPTIVGTYHAKLEKKFGPIMANRGHEVLRATFNHLIKKGMWTTINPAVGATRAAKHERDRILEDDELKPFFDALDAEENRDFAEFLGLLYATGSRKSNLYSASWDEINLLRKEWTIPGWKYKNGETTTLRLSAEAVELFRRRKQPERKPDKQWVFPSKSGSESGHVEDFKHQFERVKKKAGLANFTFHDLRRSFVANLVMSKTPWAIASEAAGHKNLASMSPYGRFDKKQVAKYLDEGVEDRERRMDAAEAEKKLLAG
jgi:integrase